MALFDCTCDAKSGNARALTFTTAHGDFRTPMFMPVGTSATVKGITPPQLRELKSQVVLANTYHLSQRPGEDVVAQAGGVHKFMNYYLPTTQKLLDSYADFEEAGVSGKNLYQAKDKIARTMDNIVAGFEQQLDRLYQSEAMDIDSDIRVMETMLRRDRGTVEDDFGLGGGTAVQSEDEEF